MSSPDHYSVLGILPTADDVVIRAAYRALAQRYHPDKWRGDPKEATEKMAEINAAYAVLSDPAKRKTFDQTRSKQQESAEPFFRDESDDREPTYDPLVDDWRIAVNFYPDLADLERGLEKLSWRVAFAYRAMMLETQDFANREAKASEIKTEFMKRHFGHNKEILQFAELLISTNNRKAALALNRAVRVLGSGVESDRVISAIISSECPPDFESPIAKRQADQYRKAVQKRKDDEEWGTVFLLVGLIFILVLVSVLVMSW
jgi:curved DNA-binding protein CbpA